MKKQYECHAIGPRDVRLVAVDERKRVTAIMLYDLLPEEAARFERGRKYVVTMEEASEES